MADESKQDSYSTYAVKLDTEVKQDLQSLLEGYKEGTGATAGDFIKTLLEVYKTNKIVVKVSSTDADIKELNTLTNRIYSIYSNLIERNSNNNDALQQEFALQLSQKDNTINNVKLKIEELGQRNDSLTKVHNDTREANRKLKEINEQLQELNNSYKLNISKLQEENIDLLGLRQENKLLSEQLETTRELLAQQQADNIKLTDNIKEKDSNIIQLNKAIEDNKNEHTNDLDRIKIDHVHEIENLKDKLTLDKDKAILELKQIHQAEQEKVQSNHNEDIEQYQEKYKALLEQLERERSTNKKTLRTTIGKPQNNK